MGEIANYKTGECYLCGKKYKGKAGLYYHFKNSKKHWDLRRELKEKGITRPTLDDFISA